MVRRVLTALLAFAAAWALVACADDEGYLEGDRLVIDECDGDEPRVFQPYHLGLRVFGFEPGEGPLYIRAQAAGEPATGVDTFVLLIEDEDELRAALKEDPTAGFALGGEGSPVRGSLLLNETCPDSYQPLEAWGGTAYFDTFGSGVGDRVRIRLLDFEIRDTRTGETVGVGFHGDMDFVIRGGHPYRRFIP